MTPDEMNDLAGEIERSDGIALMTPAGAIQLGIRRSAEVIAMLRDRSKYSLLESQFANCHKEIQSLRNALLAAGQSADAS